MGKDIFFIGEVNAKNIDQLIQNVRAAGTEEINLFISSPGGTGWLGMGFYDWVKTNGIKITTIATGYVASEAIYILLSGNVRKTTSHSIFLVHHGGFATDRIRKGLVRLIAPSLYKEDSDLDSAITEQRADIISRETKLDQSEALSYLTDKHLVFDADQAKNLGFVTEVI